MKRLLFLCLLSFCLFAHAQEAAQTPSYELDAKATASAPWKVGEVISNTTQKVYMGQMS